MLQRILLILLALAGTAVAGQIITTGNQVELFGSPGPIVLSANGGGGGAPFILTTPGGNTLTTPGGNILIGP